MTWSLNWQTGTGAAAPVRFRRQQHVRTQATLKPGSARSLRPGRTALLRYRQFRSCHFVRSEFPGDLAFAGGVQPSVCKDAGGESASGAVISCSSSRACPRRVPRRTSGSRSCPGPREWSRSPSAASSPRRGGGAIPPAFASVNVKEFSAASGVSVEHLEACRRSMSSERPLRPSRSPAGWPWARDNGLAAAQAVLAFNAWNNISGRTAVSSSHRLLPLRMTIIVPPASRR